MWEEWQRKVRQQITVLLLLLLPLLAGAKNVEAAQTAQKALQPGERVTISGEPIGIYLQTEGVLVADIGTLKDASGCSVTPAEYIARIGDYILQVNQEKVTSKLQLQTLMQQNQGDTVELLVNRDGENIAYRLQPTRTEEGDYKLGLWVRDDLQGIGTMTYIRQDQSFGALGHGISDSDSGSLLSLSGGSLYKAQILDVQKGQKGEPGELLGSIAYTDSQLLGTITANTECGVFGNLKGEAQGTRQATVASREQLHTGDASLYCNVGDGVKEYTLRIEKITENTGEKNKCFIIRVTDDELLEKTGGIIQGMSGAPILQDGRLVGAVTHVFVNDPTKGYGICAEEMMTAAKE